MLRFLATLVLLSSSVFAQYSNLVTPGDGARVAFSSSLSLKSDSAHDWPKLFEASDGQVLLIEERFPAPPPVPLPSMEAFYELLSRDSSSDGTVKALNTHRPCVGGSRCVFLEQFKGELTAPGLTATLQRGGIFRVSADGRYALSYGSTGPVPLTAVLDLRAGTVTPLPRIGGTVAPPGRRVIADDGTSVFVNSYTDQDGAVMLASRDGVVTPVRTSMRTSSAIIDAAGRFVVYESDADPHQLVLYDIAGGWELPLVWAGEGCTLPSLSDDGRLLLFLSAANWEARNDGQRVQAWLLDLATGELRQLTRDTAGIAEATLSGDGLVVWAATLAGRLLRVEVNSRIETELIGRTAALNYPASICQRGLLCDLQGRGLAPAPFQASEPWPSALGGVTVQANGMPLPLFSVAPDLVRIALPWDLLPGEYRLELTTGNSIFQEKNSTALTITGLP